MGQKFSDAFWAAMKNLFAKIPVPKIFDKIANNTLYNNVVMAWKYIIYGLILAVAFLLFGAATVAMEYLLAVLK